MYILHPIPRAQTGIPTSYKMILCAGWIAVQSHDIYYVTEDKEYIDTGTSCMVHFYPALSWQLIATRAVKSLLDVIV